MNGEYKPPAYETVKEWLSSKESERAEARDEESLSNSREALRIARLANNIAITAAIIAIIAIVIAIVYRVGPEKMIRSLHFDTLHAMFSLSVPDSPKTLMPVGGFAIA